ncbi:MAG: pentapeptide repeat-containing protein [bacterium]|nr:pentapeptide repeat-containing protein [bacterium]
MLRITLDLRGASFENTECFDVDLEGCILTGCDFTRARNLGRVNFHNYTMDQETAETIQNSGGYLPDTVTIINE